MTTVAQFREADAVGFLLLRRGNSVSIQEMGMKTLGDRLRQGFEGAAVYEPYKTNILELYETVITALSVDSELSPEGRERLIPSLLHAEDFLTNRPFGVSPPTVDVWESGKVALEWYVSPERIVTATIDQFGRLAFAAMKGVDRMSAFASAEGQWPAHLVSWIKKIKE
jgi:hypothetical protein